MTRELFVGQSTFVNILLDLIHTDLCRPLNTHARGGFSYFITFTDDYSWYGYIYLIRYKFEAFVRFKEFRLEVENQTGPKIKTLRLGRDGEYLSGEFLDDLKKNGIVSHWTPPVMPQLNGVAKRRNRTLLNMVQSMMSFSELLLSFWVWSSPAYVKRLVGDKLDSRSSLCRFIGYPKETAGYFYGPSKHKALQSSAGTSSTATVSTNNVPVLHRSARVPQPLERYSFLGVTSQLDNDPKTYGEVMLDIDSGNWFVAKGYPQRPGVDFEKTFSSVAMAKSIWIMLAIATCALGLNLAYALSIMNRYPMCAGETHWTAVKTILKYQRRTKDMFLAYGGRELVLEGHSDASLQSDDDDPKSQLRLAFKLNGYVLAWKSSK
ncbi:hypothetical protein Sango_1242000 [Sesamum angolense]|uniref:Integrase catalytic domain-containing protein n=1 Tax=Sesamum angolense TaxID=2727404 RepID=A0AAE1WQI2_9LAMI|nr:hypothetical protein Sango_1242000 [Sesamum angolense]